jgi:nucleotide-binding universal stress UspA family protein
MLSAQEQPEPQVGFSRIVVPLDGSQLAEAALPWAADIAFRLDLKLTLVMSISTALATAGVAELAPIAPEEIVQALAPEAKRYLAAVAGWGSGQGVRCEFEVLRGEAAATIADFANQVDRSLIAISTHGRSGLGRVLMGSVADALIRNSGNTVLVVRPQLREQPKAIESFPRPSEAQPVSTEHR